MIWSDATPAPHVRYMPPSPSTPGVWSLEELHATDGELFHAEGDAVTMTAAELEAQADAERARISAESYRAGYDAGCTDAEGRASETFASSLATLRSAAEQLVASEARSLGTLEDNLAALAIAIARQLIGREVRTSPDIVADLVRRAVTEFPIDQQLRIRINPLDLSTLAAAPDGDTVRIAPGRDIAWVPDARIYPGGCVIEGRERIIDGRVDTALERTYHRLVNPTT